MAMFTVQVDVRWCVSIAVKTRTKLPTCVGPGVQLTVVQTGLPEVGSGGVNVMPAGAPDTLIVTTSAGSTSEAQSWNDIGTPALPMSGPGHWMTGGLFGR